ncbi:hypothetical protein Hte_008632 [Hypoxylon texense]
MNPPVPAIICAENIAALHVLHSKPGQSSIPAQPSSNPVTKSQFQPVDYSLPFEKERSLVGTLAFLAHAKEDPNCIPAVCVEENPRAAVLNVLLAVNKGAENDGRDVLESSRQSFEEIFSILAQMDKRNDRTKKRRSIKETLQTVDECLKRIELEGKKALPPTSKSFIQKARDVIGLVDSWSKHHTDLELEKLVDGIYRLQGVGSLDALFNTIDDRDMHMSSRKSLLGMINKVARYRESARIIYRMAKKFPLVRRMRIEIVRLPAKAFERIPDRTGYTPKLDTNISSMNGLKKSERNFAYLCQLMDTSRTNANNRFAERARKTLREGKIHAEIQLLYHCKLYITHPRHPRVVCSSKDACWLCNEFILMYKKIHTPKGHGKLYPGWRLPSLPEPDFDGITGQFNRRLMEFFKGSLRQLFERKERTIYKDPAESTLLTYIWSASTLPSTAPAEAEKAGNSTRAVILPPESRGTQKSEGGINVEVSEVPAEPEAKTPETSSPEGEETTRIPPPQRNSPGLRSEMSSPSQDDISRKRAETKHKRVKKGEASPLHKAGKTGHLEVQIEYAGSPDPNTPSHRQRSLPYTIKKLRPKHVEKLRNREDVDIIDASSFDDENEIDHRADGDGFFYLASGDTVLRICFKPVVVEP